MLVDQGMEDRVARDGGLRRLLHALPLKLLVGNDVPVQVEEVRFFVHLPEYLGLDIRRFCGWWIF